MFSILPSSFLSDGELWAQEEDEEEGLSTKALSDAKNTLQEMGMKLGDKIGRVGNSREMKFAYTAEINDSQKAFSMGFGLAQPRPTPVKTGTTLSIVIDAKGKVTIFVDSQNKMKNSNNQNTSVVINKDVILDDVQISASAFPNIIK